MKELLEKINIIDLKAGKLEAKKQFNIFTILRNGNDERNLHSKFIYELLNEVGPNKLYKRFLEEFLKVLEIENFSFKNYVAYTESENIDLLLQNDKKAIIIENKIYAGDQNNQLQRYYNIIKKEGYEDVDIFTYYLTLNGKEPSDSSVGNLNRKQIKLISYTKHITKWIEVCIEITINEPAIKEILIQYKALINNLSGGNMETKKENEIIDVLTQGNNMLSAKIIVDKWNKIRVHTEFSYWEDLENKLTKKYNILSHNKYSLHKIKGLIDAKKNHDKKNNYGISIEMFSYLGNKVILFVDIWGSFNLDFSHKKVKSVRKMNKVFDELKNISDADVYPITTNSGMFFEKYFDFKTEFSNFDEPDTLNLIKPEFRKKVITNHCKQIDEFVNKVFKIIEDLK